jgi:hypothetical protein
MRSRIELTELSRSNGERCAWRRDIIGPTRLVRTLLSDGPMRRIATLMAVTLMGACSSQLAGYAGGAQGGTGGTPTGAGGAGGGGSPPGLPAEVAALCNAAGGHEITFQDKADAQAHLVGRWILCRTPGLTWATEQPDQGGIELDADMTWHMLHWVGGTLTAADGFQASNSYSFSRPEPLDYAPDMTAFLFFGIDYSFVKATMLDSPSKMRWDNGSIYLREANTN